MVERFPGFLKALGCSPMNVFKLFLPVLAGCRSRLINDDNLHVGRGSVFRVLVANERKVRADIAKVSDALPPIAKARVVKAQCFADNRDQASTALQSAQCAR